MAEKSGAAWVGRFPGSKSLDKLEAGFRSKVSKFMEALHNASATTTVISTVLPAERVFLMHWCYRIAKDDAPADQVPVRAGIDIDWWHGDQRTSRQAAQEMFDGYGLDPNMQTVPPLSSNRMVGLAIDLATEWTGTLQVKKVDGTMVSIEDGPRNSTNSKLIVVGRTYGVIHLTPFDHNPNHWSTNGL